jgi:hypothetical protein
MACAGLLAVGALTGPAGAADLTAVQKDRLARLLKAYPETLAGVDGDQVVFRSGTRLPFDDGRGPKAPADWLDEPDIEDMLAQPYRAGPAAAPPGRDADPGRARNLSFFRAMYGDCRKGQVARHLVDVVWLPRKSGVRIKATRINGVARRLAAVSRELDALPDRFTRFLIPPAGTYVCRNIAGTRGTSAHGFGIAVDIASAPAHYWRWSGGAGRYRNAIPQEIVAIFEKHGFIWGGKWFHYDTMHFEYRPELLPPSADP